jgi:hypothetical protein
MKGGNDDLPSIHRISLRPQSYDRACSVDVESHTMPHNTQSLPICIYHPKNCLAERASEHSFVYFYFYIFFSGSFPIESPSERTRAAFGRPYFPFILSFHLSGSGSGKRFPDLDSRMDQRANDDTLGGVSTSLPLRHTYIIQPILPFDLDSLIAFSLELMWHGFLFAAPLFPSQRTTEDGSWAGMVFRRRPLLLVIRWEWWIYYEGCKKSKISPTGNGLAR